MPTTNASHVKQVRTLQFLINVVSVKLAQKGTIKTLQSRPAVFLVYLVHLLTLKPPRHVSNVV